MRIGVRLTFAVPSAPVKVTRPPGAELIAFFFSANSPFLHIHHHPIVVHFVKRRTMFETGLERGFFYMQNKQKTPVAGLASMESKFHLVLRQYLCDAVESPVSLRRTERIDRLWRGRRGREITTGRVVNRLRVLRSVPPGA